MTPEDQNQRQLAVRIATAVSDDERAAMLAWAQKLLEIRSSELPTLQKGKRSRRVGLTQLFDFKNQDGIKGAVAGLRGAFSSAKLLGRHEPQRSASRFMSGLGHSA